MRRRDPRPLTGALDAFVAEQAPQTLLAQVQLRWVSTVGPVVAAEAEPLAERDGVVTVACTSSVWAHEMALLGPDIARRLNEALGASTGASVKALKTTIRRNG